MKNCSRRPRRCFRASVPNCRPRAGRSGPERLERQRETKAAALLLRRALAGDEGGQGPVQSAKVRQEPLKVVFGLPGRQRALTQQADQPVDLTELLPSDAELLLEQRSLQFALVQLFFLALQLLDP